MSEYVHVSHCTVHDLCCIMNVECLGVLSIPRLPALLCCYYYTLHLHDLSGGHWLQLQLASWWSPDHHTSRQRRAHSIQCSESRSIIYLLFWCTTIIYSIWQTCTLQWCTYILLNIYICSANQNLHKRSVSLFYSHHESCQTLLESSNQERREV